MTGGYRWTKDACPDCGKHVVSPVSRGIQGHYCKDENGNRVWRDYVSGSKNPESKGMRSWLTELHTHEPVEKEDSS